MLDSRVLRDQELNERMQQRFALLSDAVHTLEETQVKPEFLLWKVFQSCGSHVRWLARTHNG